MDRSRVHYKTMYSEYVYHVCLKDRKAQCGITIVYRMCLPNGTTYWRVNRTLWVFWNYYSFSWRDCWITDTRRVLLTFVGYNVSKGVMSGTAAFLSGMAGAMLGITLSYILGLKLGLPVLKNMDRKLELKNITLKNTYFI